MSDPARGSVRTGARASDVPTPGSPPTETSVADPGSGMPVSATQSIPTGTNRVVQAGQNGAQGAPVPPRQPVAPATGAGRPAVTARAGAPGAPPAGRKSGSGRGPRRARLQLRHIDTWSAFKISLVLSIALFFIWMVAVGVLYGVLSGLGVFTTLNELFGQLGAASGTGGGGDVITPGIVFGAAAVIGGINVFLLTALGTMATFIYNLSSDLVGGLEVTLSERD